ncbi:dynamin family protein [Paenarthrobacter sp. JL.01a]|uniref:dynamin family protein n=1 Tax=Paenarthrobacter sp. JL.01a TaxID=2979324 RepID=UPI0021C5C167|nr:dynamin family protein [Paenarthrobacter sp. JL.01a]UXM90852.1 dynamin family protein [Paenarthrobacter sp. JL.01a]
MIQSGIAGAAELLRQARELYQWDPAALAVLDELDQRLAGPLRIAVAGMVKAGKSTLLNAIIGEEIAPTDAGECTRIVTWYRYGHAPRITLHPLTGEPRALPVNRIDGRLVFSLGELQAEDVEKLVVDWPSASLQDLTLIDTPGIASLSSEVSGRSTAFLLPEDAPMAADAVIYLMRHLHASDVHFLESFKDTAAGKSGTVNALAVLSRADEIGAGRIDALISAAVIADRYSRDENLKPLALGVVPVAGLLAQSARTMRQRDVDAFMALARLDRNQREKMMLSVDRFVRAGGPDSLDPELKASLVQRFGLFGIRLAVALIRGGIDSPTELAHELARRSGLGQLLGTVDSLFQTRAEALKARAAVVGLQSLLSGSRSGQAAVLETALEQLLAGAHEFKELKLLGLLRTGGAGLTPGQSREAEQLVGGRGNLPHQRLGLSPEAGLDEIARATRDALDRWRHIAENPLLVDSAAVDACRVVLRSCEGILAAMPVAR